VTLGAATYATGSAYTGATDFGEDAADAADGPASAVIAAISATIAAARLPEFLAISLFLSPNACDARGRSELVHPKRTL